MVTADMCPCLTENECSCGDACTCEGCGCEECIGGIIGCGCGGNCACGANHEEYEFDPSVSLN